MIPRQCFADLMLLVIEGDIVLYFVEVLPWIFGHGLRPDAIGGCEVFKPSALGRVRLFRLVLAPVTFFRLQIDCLFLSSKFPPSILPVLASGSLVPADATNCESMGAKPPRCAKISYEER